MAHGVYMYLLDMFCCCLKNEMRPPPQPLETETRPSYLLIVCANINILTYLLIVILWKL